MGDGEYHRPVRMSREEAIRLGIIKPEPQHQTMSQASERRTPAKQGGAGYAKLSKKTERRLFPKPKAIKAKRRRTVASAHKKERYLKRKEGEATKGATSFLKHITATPEERAAAIKRRRRL